MSDRFRIVRADGTYPTDAMSELTWREAVDFLAGFNREPATTAGWYGPYRIQRMTWEDVPVPEPLPDLPDTVWAWTDPMLGGPYASFKPDGDPHVRRLFRGRVVEWEEITE